MKDLKDLAVKFWAKTLGKTPEEVSSLLFKKEADAEVMKDDAYEQLLELDKARVKTFDDDRKVHYDKGYKKAAAEVLSKREKELKDKFAITEDKQGDELIDAIIAAKSSGSSTEPTEDQVKRHKAYLDLHEKLKQDKETATKEWKDKYEAREKELARGSTLKTISEKARTFIKSLNPILPQDETKAENQIKEVIDNFLATLEYEIKEDGKIVVLKKEGDQTKVMVDDHSHPVSFEDLLKERATKHWDFKEGDSRAGTGNNNDNNGNSGGNKGYSGPIPKNEAEYMDMIGKATDDKSRTDITKAWMGSRNKS